jgi:hypothetical protein
MNSPTPVPPAPANPGLTPSASTVGTTVAGAVAFLIIVVLAQFHIILPVGAEAAITCLVGALGGYLPKSGRI